MRSSLHGATALIPYMSDRDRTWIGSAQYTDDKGNAFSRPLQECCALRTVSSFTAAAVPGEPVTGGEPTAITGATISEQEDHPRVRKGIGTGQLRNEGETCDSVTGTKLSAPVQGR